MSAKTLDRQTAKFLARISENIPVVSSEVMQGWIQNPRALQKVLREALVPPAMGRFINIDRTLESRLFDPARIKILGQGWKIDEQDERALDITELDITQIRFKHMLRKGESLISGEERWGRLKDISIISGTIRLDAKILFALLKKPKLIPEWWNEKRVYFDGTVLRSPEGHRYVLYMYCRGKNSWGWGWTWLEEKRGVDHPSAVLTSI